ncbi:MAG TPA: SpvB/TcaC N-terminal domain-containing protein, partial [Candidatus Binatia bacterium]|nr:SpvB/TcaC N-terminal domain-containing protein [Candidatus Binatia bacterium]
MVRRHSMNGCNECWARTVALAVLLASAPGWGQSLPPDGSVPNAAAPGFDPAGALGVLNDAAANADPSAAPAFAGLARELTVDPLTGAATTSIPIDVPPGRKGMTPALTLTYSSNSGNGLLGVGWDMPLGYIKRDTRRGVPSYLLTDPATGTIRDTFVLTFRGGTIVLNRILGSGPSTITYGSSIEEAALSVVLNTTTNQWTITDRSGVQYTYGGALTDDATRTGTNVTTTSGTFAWALVSVVDP